MHFPIWWRKYVRSFFSKVDNSQYQYWKKERMQKFYEQFIKSGNLCFDIGANVGNYSSVFLQLGGIVIAVEPIRENINSLNQRFKNEENLIVVGSAVSSEEGVSEIHKGSSLDLSTLEKGFVSFNEQQSNHKWQDTQSVNLTTLDELIKIHGIPQFCKIDVEGHETEVLAGLTALVPVISFEFLFPFKEQAMDCIQIINKLSPNAAYNYSLFEFFELENEQWLDSKSFLNHLSNLPKSHWTGDIFCKLL
jgi:FkbM family methyltransferase